MPSAIDHLVIAVPDPEAAAGELEAELGIAATGGGEHPGAGTYNRLVFLGDAYLELIGVRRRGGRRLAGRSVRRPLNGRCTPAAASRRSPWSTTSSRATVDPAARSGSTIGPYARLANAADGEKVEWWTATFDELGPDRPPFLIRHAYTGAEWGEEALERRRTFVHPSGRRSRWRDSTSPPLIRRRWPKHMTASSE